MAYTTAQGQQELLDELAAAIDLIGRALASLGAAYEQLDEHTADRLEAELFGPVQAAYGRARRTHSEFAKRHGLPGRGFEMPTPGVPSTGASRFIDTTVEAAIGADGTLAALQDSMLPTEVGDVEVRAGIAQVRELLSSIPQRARQLQRTLGR